MIVSRITAKVIRLISQKLFVAGMATAVLPLLREGIDNALPLLWAGVSLAFLSLIAQTAIDVLLAVREERSRN